jgi:hypothetical protein
MLLKNLVNERKTVKENHVLRQNEFETYRLSFSFFLTLNIGGEKKTFEWKSF